MSAQGFSSIGVKADVASESDAADMVSVACSEYGGVDVLVNNAGIGVVQKVTVLGNTGNVNFGWFAYDSTDGHPKKCYPILNHADIF